MIKASELRVGNVIQDAISLETNLIVFKIEDGIITCGDDDFSYPYLTESLIPIPLSEEVLLACGFEIVNNDLTFVAKPNGNCHIVFIKEIDEYMVSVTGAFGMVQLPRINSLHELQNLYYALTKTELNYQPK